MRRAIAIVLSAILVSTSTKPALARDDQQESQVTATNIPNVVTPGTNRDPARIGVPVVEPNSRSALLFTVGLRDHTLARNALTLSPPFRRASTAGKVLSVVLGLIGAVAFFFLVLCIEEGCSA